MMQYISSTVYACMHERAPFNSFLLMPFTETIIDNLYKYLLSILQGTLCKLQAHVSEVTGGINHGRCVDTPVGLAWFRSIKHYNS